uniref:Transposase n=1 Tax=Panagrellus redivivus TaxID=6233 RepID=A0A7E4V6G7_PANRE
MNKLVIHDAALLVDDAIAHLPLPQRLNAAQKFAKTARIVSYQGEAIILQVTKHLRLTTGKIRGNCRITRVLPLPKDDDPNDDLNSICETMSVLSFSSRQSQQSQKGGRNRMAERFWTSLMEGNSWMKS